MQRRAKDKHATLMRNVDFPMLAVLVGTQPLQEPPDHLGVHFADGLWNWVSVLIFQVGFGASKRLPILSDSETTTSS